MHHACMSAKAGEEKDRMSGANEGFVVKIHVPSSLLAESTEIPVTESKPYFPFAPSNIVFTFLTVWMDR